MDLLRSSIAAAYRADVTQSDCIPDTEPVDGPWTGHDWSQDGFAVKNGLVCGATAERQRMLWSAYALDPIPSIDLNIIANNP